MGRKLSAAQRLEIADFPFEESEFPLEWMPRREGVDRGGEWLLALERKIKPEIVHHNTVALAHLPFQAPSVVTVHSCVLSWREAVKNCAEIVAPNHAMLAAARHIYGLGARGIVVPNAKPYFPERSQFSEIKEPFVCAAVRVWDEAKNLEALRRVAPGLSWPVKIAGEGGELGFLEAAERAAIYAWPARYEPFGLSVLEAAQHRCALVLGYIASVRENWDGAALFVRDHDLFEAIQKLITDPDLRNELGFRAFERSRRFQAHATVHGYSAAYGKVLSGALCAS